ncbi:MAG: hypothetical protein WD595_00050 [Waddliaceae bacterium]
MVRISKQNQRRATSPRKPKIGAEKTGPKKDNLSKGYREHENAVPSKHSESIFVGKVG